METRTVRSASGMSRMGFAQQVSSTMRPKSKPWHSLGMIDSLSPSVSTPITRGVGRPTADSSWEGDAITVQYHDTCTRLVAMKLLLGSLGAMDNAACKTGGHLGSSWECPPAEALFPAECGSRTLFQGESCTLCMNTELPQLPFSPFSLPQVACFSSSYSLLLAHKCLLNLYK